MMRLATIVFGAALMVWFITWVERELERVP